jgi:hypothetical protein
MLGIDIGAWFSAVIATSGSATAQLGAGVPLLDPGPMASVLALGVACALMWHARRRAHVA